MAKGFLDGRKQALFDFCLLDCQIAVASDPEGHPVDDLEAAKKRIEPGPDHIFQKHKPAFVVFLVGKRNKPVQDRGHLEHCVQSSGRILRGGLDPQDEIQALIVQVRKGVGWVDCQRRQNGIDLLLEVLVQERLSRFAELVGTLDHDAAFGEFGLELFVPDLVLSASAFMGAPGDFDELFERTEPVGGRVLGLEVVVQLSLQAGDANLEEFVEIRGRDRKEADAFEQRVGFVSGLFENAVVEAKPTEFSVDEERGFDRGAVALV